jgi:hypothetical protein
MSRSQGHPEARRNLKSALAAPPRVARRHPPRAFRQPCLTLEVLLRLWGSRLALRRALGSRGCHRPCRISSCAEPCAAAAAAILRSWLRLCSLPSSRPDPLKSSQSTAQLLHTTRPQKGHLYSAGQQQHGACKQQSLNLHRPTATDGGPRRNGLPGGNGRVAPSRWHHTRRVRSQVGPAAGVLLGQGAPRPFGPRDLQLASLTLSQGTGRGQASHGIQPQG